MTEEQTPGTFRLPLRPPYIQRATHITPTVITEEQAHAMGAKGAPPTEAERLLFEAWMRGHCWAYPDTWNGVTYMDTAPWVEAKMPDPYAMQTRRLWAAWRDRAALGQPLAAS